MSVQGIPGVGKMDRRTHYDHCANPVAFAEGRGARFRVAAAVKHDVWLRVDGTTRAARAA